MSVHVKSNMPGGMRYTISLGTHDVPLDMPAPKGEGPSPHDYFDAALGGCKVLTLMVYAKGKNIPLDSVDVEIVRDDKDERRGEYRLTARLVLSGDLTDEQVAELHAVADRCPVHKLMTTTTIKIDTEVARA
ncbi:MAG: osmotically inducible protein OsmC [Bordetella sp. SCN 67-23]|nr:OsmC family protein [Burkholderiales bacterium]ODS74375.1 MAG: osmotically inducible protein OsmC [Bordetella sp. SCN 67-23]ODU83949.1 MAG: osmotically inducible protein OsmC [Bordetella sp. SCN 68-11]OJW89590.1 MAG: osmotically inducible protein OsmC [Burkholderiales bacterium 67-32]